MNTEAENSRVAILREILWNRVAKAVWAVVGLWCAFTSWLPPDIQENLTLYSLTHNRWPGWLWAVVVSVCVAVLSLSGAVHAIQAERQKRSPSPDRLDSLQVSAIIKTVHAGQARWHDVLRAGGCPEEEIKPFEIQLIAMGDELRTLEYRSDLFKAFEGGGFKVLVDECPPGALEFEQFIGAVTVIAAENPNNAIRPIVVDALRSAGIEISEAPNAPFYSPRRHLYHHFAATVIVGQRR